MVNGSGAPLREAGVEPVDADGDARRVRLDHVLSASVVVWLLMTLFLLVWQERPQAGPSDPVAHVVLFAGLTFTVRAFISTREHPRWVMWASTAAILALAAASELVQAGFVSQRSGSFADFVADALGVCLGIVLATGLTLLPPAGGRVTAAVASSLAAALIAGFVAVSFVRESAWWRCREYAGAPIERSLTDLADGPMLEFDGNANRWTGPDSEHASGTRAPDRAAGVAWCAAIVSEELTLVVVTDSGAIAREPMVEVFATTSGLDGATPNLKLEARHDLLTVRARHRVRPPRITNFHFDDVFGEPGRQWVAVRYQGGEMTVDTDAGQILREDVELAFGAWNIGIPMDVHDERLQNDAMVTYVGFFDRSLHDRELVDAIDGVLG